MRMPEPENASRLDDLVTALRLLKAWSHDMSYAAITRAVNDRWQRAGRPRGELTRRSTVAGYFTFGRARLDEDLLVAIVQALHPDADYAERWRGALRAIRGDATTAALVDARGDLPDAPDGFVGRRAELRRLDALAAGGTVVIHGMAGVGKTWLALHAAHRLAGGGGPVRLVADLRGQHPEAPAACPSAVLGGFLRHLGLRPEQIPHGLPARVATYRALLRDVAALIVLDDAAGEDSVAPLLPDGPRHLVMITSRHRLAGLRGAARLHLHNLDPADSLDLLRHTAGRGRVDADVAGARRITARVGWHPHAVAIVGGHLREHPDWPVADCARPVWLALAGGVRSALAVSCRVLPSAARRVLRLLSLHPGHDVGCPAVAALAGTDVGTVRGDLHTLIDAHLLRQPADGRFALHELVRGYAAELVGVEERASQVSAATARLFDYYRHTAAVAVGRLDPALDPAGDPAGDPAPATAAGTGAPCDDRHVARHTAEAWQWLALEHANLLAVTAQAADRGCARTARDLATSLWRYQRASEACRAVSGIVRGGPPPPRTWATVRTRNVLATQKSSRE